MTVWSFPFWYARNDTEVGINCRTASKQGTCYFKYILTYCSEFQYQYSKVFFFRGHKVSLLYQVNYFTTNLIICNTEAFFRKAESIVLSHFLQHYKVTAILQLPMSSRTEKLKWLQEKNQNQIIRQLLVWNDKLLYYYSLSCPTPFLHIFPPLPDKLCEQAEEVQTTLKNLVKATGIICIIQKL